MKTKVTRAIDRIVTELDESLFALIDFHSDPEPQPEDIIVSELIDKVRAVTNATERAAVYKRKPRRKGKSN